MLTPGFRWTVPIAGWLMFFSAGYNAARPNEADAERYCGPLVFEGQFHV
jgi:hypothetical protein